MDRLSSPLVWTVVAAVVLAILVERAARLLFGVGTNGYRLVFRTGLVLANSMCGIAVLSAVGVDTAGIAETIGKTTLFRMGDSEITLITLVVFVGLLVLARYTSVLAREATTRALAVRRFGDKGTIASVSRLVQYAVVFVGVAVALESVGIDLDTLVTFGAVFAVGVGLAMQQIAQNFVSGVILLAERTITPGDVVRVDGRMVRVRKMGIRATIARTLDDDDLIIPNTFLVQANVHNYTMNDSHYRVRLPVGVAYGSDLDTVLRVLHTAARSMDGMKDPVVALTSFADSSVVFEVSVWIDDPWGELQARSQLAFAVWNALADAHVEIAFPQLDVHIKNSPEPT